MVFLAALLLGGPSTGFVYMSGYGYPNARPGQTVPSVPSPVASLGRVAQVAGGYFHAHALKPNGTVWSWGYGHYGQLGLGYPKTAGLPKKIKSLPACRLIDTAPNYSLFLTTEGTVYGCGLNLSGQLGTNALRKATTPVQIAGLTGIVDIAASSGTSYALRSDGQVLAWGDNSYGQIGDGTNTKRTNPTIIPNLFGIVQIESKGIAAFALRSDGAVFGWGYNGGGRLGVGSAEPMVLVPTLVDNLSNVTKLAASPRHTLALLADGTVSSWGANNYGELGDPSIPESYYGTDHASPIPDLSGVMDVSANEDVSAVLKTDHTVWVFGRTNDVLNSFKSSTPALVPNLAPVTSLSLGNHNTYIVCDTDAPLWFTVSPGSLVGGYDQADLVVHTELIPTKDLTLSLSSNSNAIGVPSTITLPAGKATVSTRIFSPEPVDGYQAARITGIRNGLAIYTDVTLFPKILQISLGQEVLAGDSRAAIVTTNFPAPPDGLVVNLESSDTENLVVQPSVTIPAGGNRANFNIYQMPSVAGSYTLITATSGQLTTQAGIISLGTWLASLTGSHTEIIGGNPLTVTIKLPQPAPAQGVKFAIATSSTSLVVPAAKTALAGTDTVVFRVGTYAVHEPTSEGFTVFPPTGTGYRTLWFTILPPSLSSVFCSPNQVVGGTSTTLTIALDGVSAGDTVEISSASPLIQTPSSFEIPAGARKAQLTVTTSAVSQRTTTYVSAKLRDRTITAKLVLNPN